MDVLGARRAAKTIPFEEDGQREHAPASTAEDVLDWQWLCGAIEQLEAQQREILRLRYFAGLSYRELGETLSIPPGTVMSRLHLARKALAALAREKIP